MSKVADKSRIVFRNPKQMAWYLQRRPNQPKNEMNYILGPNETVEALDEAEEMLLASVGLIDVTKESPAIKNSMDVLRQELEAERAKNADLVAQNKALQGDKPSKTDTANTKTK